MKGTVGMLSRPLNRQRWRMRSVRHLILSKAFKKKKKGTGLNAGKSFLKRNTSVQLFIASSKLQVQRNGPNQEADSVVVWVCGMGGDGRMNNADTSRSLSWGELEDFSAWSGGATAWSTGPALPSVELLASLKIAGNAVQRHQLFPSLVIGFFKN